MNYLPVKEKILHRRHRWFYYFLFECKGRCLVHQRTAKDIWQHLYEFYLLETASAQVWTDDTVQQWLAEQSGIRKGEVVQISPVAVQQLTHQQIRGQFIRVNLPAIPLFLKHHQWVPVDRLHELPFPKFITQYLIFNASSFVA